MSAHTAVEASQCLTTTVSRVFDHKSPMERNPVRLLYTVKRQTLLHQLRLDKAVFDCIVECLSPGMAKTSLERGKQNQLCIQRLLCGHVLWATNLRASVGIGLLQPQFEAKTLMVKIIHSCSTLLLVAGVRSKSTCVTKHMHRKGVSSAISLQTQRICISYITLNMTCAQNDNRVQTCSALQPSVLRRKLHSKVDVSAGQCVV